MYRKLKKKINHLLNDARQYQETFKMKRLTEDEAKRIWSSIDNPLLKS